MTPVEEQFEILRADQPQARMDRMPDGSYLVTIPDCPLPEGKWSKPTITVKFVAPVGYPFSRPDCFWTDHDLRLANNGMPANTGNTALPHVAEPHLWFSWHVSSWNPNADSLLTYLHVIERRLEEPK